MSPTSGHMASLVPLPSIPPDKSDLSASPEQKPPCLLSTSLLPSQPRYPCRHNPISALRNLCCAKCSLSIMIKVAIIEVTFMECLLRAGPFVNFSSCPFHFICTTKMTQELLLFHLTYEKTKVRAVVRPNWCKIMTLHTK